ncbi:MAG: hypothetical protein HYW47_06930 [Deltaproteobacteria bacterium]|nr:hypothetical protein [Deltaproteobacteria bacterium]
MRRFFLIIIAIFPLYFVYADFKPWETEDAKKKLESGKVLNFSTVEDLPHNHKKLTVTAFGYVPSTREKLRAIAKDPQVIKKLSGGNIQKAEILYFTKKERIFYFNVCFFWCQKKYDVAVLMSPRLGKKEDRIPWELLSKDKLKTQYKRSVASVTVQDFDFSGMKGETFVKELKKDNLLVALTGEITTQSSSFIRFMQTAILKFALTKMATNMRENLSKFNEL